LSIPDHVPAAIAPLLAEVIATRRVRDWLAAGESPIEALVAGQPAGR
jgi:hypothetical protein